MAKNDARKSFVAARLKETGKEATPEQRAKFRERFNTLSQTKEGRTTIAQKVLPGGTAAERKALKSSIRTPQTSTSTTSTTETTPNKTDYPGFVNKGYGKGILNNVNLPSNNFSSSAPIPSTTTTVPIPSTTTTGPRTTKTSTSSGKSGVQKTLDWLGKGMPGTDEWKAKPGLGVADIPLGAGKLITGLREAKKGNIWGGLGHAVAGGVELGFTIASAFEGKPIIPRNTVIEPVTEINTSQLFTAAEDFNIAKMQKALNTYAPGVKFTPSAITGANKPTSMPVLPKFPAENIASSAEANAAARTAALEDASTVPVTTPKSTVTKPRGAKPTIAKPVEAKPTVAKPVEAKSATPSPPVTTPMKYDAEGFRLNQVGERVTDPTSDAGLKGWRPGDAKPKAPPVGRTKGKTTTEWFDYEYRLDAYNKYNPKKK